MPKRPRGLLRLVGLALLIVLLWRIDKGKLVATVGHADHSLVMLAMLMNIPLVCLRAARWQCLLWFQGIPYGVGNVMLSYWGSIFIGLLTPGRLGEFTKAFHVSRDCGVGVGRALASVLVDRLCDLYILALIGGVALLSLTSGQTGSGLVGLVILGTLLTLPFVLLFYEGTFRWEQTWGLSLARFGRRLSAFYSWLLELRSGFREMTWSSLCIAGAITVLAYVIFFVQCYLLAVALNLKVGVVLISYAVALGSLVTLLPVSISGLGTREAVIIACLGTGGIPAEAALSFSLLVFFVFYLMGGLMGAVAWWIKPIPLKLASAKTDSLWPSSRNP